MNNNTTPELEKHTAITEEMREAMQAMKGEKPSGLMTMFRLMLCWVQSVNSKLDAISQAIKSIEVVDDEFTEKY